MVRYFARQSGRLQELPAAQPACWVHFSPPFSHDELEDAAQQFGIPLDFLTDPLDIDERSRYEKEDDVKLILLGTPILNEVDADNEATYITVPMGIILTPDHVLTICSFENPVLELFLEDKVKAFDPALDRKFVLQILEQNVYRYLSNLKKLNLKRNLIERELYDSSRNRELKQLLSIEKSLVYFVNSLNANELLLMKMKRTNYLAVQEDEDLNEIFEDLLIDNGQALEMANVYTNILNGTMEAYASIINNNLNMVIHRLTMVTIVLAVPTLVASLFGMNVQLPLGANNPYAFYVVLGIAATASIVLVAWVRKQR